MDLSAVDVENKEFTEARKGYAREEVDAFLDQVAAQFRRYDERLQTMMQRITAMEAELGQSRETEEMSRRMLLVAQRAADDAVAEAEERAKAMLEDAERQAHALEEESRRRVGAAEEEMKRRLASLQSDVEALRRFEGEFRAQLRQTLESHLTVLQRTGATLPPAGADAPQPAAATPAPAAAAAGAPVRPGPVRVADNEVLRRLAESGTDSPTR